MKEKLAIVGALIVIAGACYGVFTYLERFALCEDVKKVDQKVDKSMQMMEYKFKAIDLRTTEDRIYDMEKRYGSSPTDTEKKADLEKLKREREQTIREMNDIKKEVK